MTRIESKWKASKGGRHIVESGKQSGAPRRVARAGRSAQRRGEDPMPEWVEPMKALMVEGIPAETDQAQWAFETKWDGVRALAFCGGHGGAKSGGGFRLYSRNHKDATFRYPELAELGAAFGSRTAILDGEIIALDAKGNPSFPELQKRMNVTRPEAVARMAHEVPAVYVVFDVLYLDGRDLRERRWDERHELLESLTDLFPPSVRTGPIRLGKADAGRGGETMLAMAEEKGLEGVVGKRIDSQYEAGLRTGAWVKVKIVQRQELVVGGWVPELSLEGKLKPNEIGAILLGYYSGVRGEKSGGDDTFHFAGAVGTGFTRESSAAMVARLRGLESKSNPFDESVPIRKFRAPVHWVKPRVVVEVEYRRWPVGGLMHQAAFKGVREDKAARDVVRELPAETPE